MGWLDDAQEAYDSGKDLVSESLPSGLDELGGLKPDSIENLVDFATSPFLFIIQLFINRLILPAAEFGVQAIEYALGPIVDIPEYLGSPLYGAGTLIYELLAGIIMTINDAIVSMATVAGPAAPLVVIVFWAGIAVVASSALRNGIRLLPQVIPWL